MTERKKNPTGTSPKGSLKYPKLDKADLGTKDYPKPNGEYSTKLVMKAEDKATKAFIATLQPHYNAAMEKAEEEFAKLKVETRKKLKAVSQNSMFTTLYDKETEEPTGEIEFKFAMTASGVRKDKTKWSAKPGVFDAKGNPITKVPEIWSGSIGKVSFEMQPYFIPGTGAAGLKLKLKAVQLIELRSGGARSADSYGFEAEEDGYEYEEEAGNEEGFSDESGAEGGSASDADQEF